MTIALETSELGRRYLTSWGLKNCTLTVPKGAVVGLVGPNGSGKSTLLRLAAGVSRPSVGSVHVFGERPDPNSVSYLSRVSYLDQNRPLYKQFRVDEMLKWGRLMNPHWDGEYAHQLLNDLGVPFDWKIGLLSGGQQAQVALAMCLGRSSDLALLDEPMANLDPLVRQGVAQMVLDSVADRGVTVVLSSHLVGELEPMCDRVVLLSKARVEISESTEELLASHHVLIGPSDTLDTRAIDVISEKKAGRQATYLVRGDVGTLGPEWQTLAPDLQEIVLAYLARPAATSATSTIRLDRSEGEIQ